jgi:hypothetical protein
MNKIPVSNVPAVESNDFWTEQDEAVQERYLHNSEGEDLGTALGVLALGAAALCGAGIAISALILRS